MKINRSTLEAQLALIIDPALARLVVSSYVEMQQRYFEGDWKPAELDGGQFCEAIARALYQADTGNITADLPGKVCECLTDRGKILTAHKLGKKDRDHFCRILQNIYKLRSDRGVAHISPTHNANHADATLIIASVNWIFAEFLRLVWNSDRSQVAAIIEAIVQLEHPLVYELDGKPIILSTALGVPEQILLLLNRAPGGRLTRDELRSFIDVAPSVVSTSITRLTASKEIGIANTGDVAVTPIGQKRVREVIIPKAQNINSVGVPGRRRITSASKRRTERKRASATSHYKRSP